MSRILYPPVPFMTLDDLSESTLNSRTKFNDMFTIPYLELVKVTTSEDDNTTVYPMIHAAWQSFNDMELRDTTQVRNVNIFALNMTNVLPLVPQSFTVAQFIQVYGTVVDKYAEMAKASEEQSKSFYTQFSQQIVVIEKALTSMKEVISKLTTQIEQKNQEIQQQNALNTLYTTLKRIFNLVEEKDTVLDMVMMTFSDLNQTFQNMSQPLLEQLVLRLKQLRDAYVSAYSKSDALQRALTDTIQYSSNINGTWASLQSDFQKMNSNNALFPDKSTINYIINDWNTVKDVAQQYLQKKSSNGLSGQPNPPRTNSDVMKMLMKSRSLTNQVQTLLKSGSGTTERSALYAVSRSALPTNVQDMWNQINKDSGTIVSEINSFLEFPLLVQINVQTDSGTTDLRTRFQDLLNTQQNFQVQSVPVLRQLYSFIEKNDTIDSNYIKTYTQLVNTFKDGTDTLLQQHMAFRNSFEVLQAQMQQTLNSCHSAFEAVQFAVLSYYMPRMDALLQNSIYAVSFALSNICQDTEANLTLMKAMASLSPIPDGIIQSYNNNWKNCMNSIYSYVRVVSNTGSN